MHLVQELNAGTVLHDSLTNGQVQLSRRSLIIIKLALFKLAINVTSLYLKLGLEVEELIT